MKQSFPIVVLFAFACSSAGAASKYRTENRASCEAWKSERIRSLETKDQKVRELFTRLMRGLPSSMRDKVKKLKEKEAELLRERDGINADTRLSARQKMPLLMQVEDARDNAQAELHQALRRAMNDEAKNHFESVKAAAALAGISIQLENENLEFRYALQEDEKPRKQVTRLMKYSLTEALVSSSTEPHRYMEVQVESRKQVANDRMYFSAQNPICAEASETDATQLAIMSDYPEILSYLRALGARTAPVPASPAQNTNVEADAGVH